jgi:hypothetical protein
MFPTWDETKHIFLGENVDSLFDDINEPVKENVKLDKLLEQRTKSLIRLKFL